MKTQLYIADIKSIDGEKFVQVLNDLSDYRKNKVLSYKNKDDRLRSLAAGLLLKYALSENGIKEKDASFAEDVHGKPFIPDADNLFFNLSHSGDYVLCAIGNSPVGCDIEKVRGINPAVYKKCLSGKETDLIQSLPQEERDTAFLKLWTQKESYVKMTGEGIGKSLVTVSAINGIFFDCDRKTDFVVNTYDYLKDYVFSVCTKVNRLPQKAILADLRILI